MKGVQHVVYHDRSSGDEIRIGIIIDDGIECQVFFNTESGEPLIEGNKAEMVRIHASVLKYM